MKTIISVWHSGEKGKSGTIREFANLLLSEYPNFKSKYPIPAIKVKSGDFILIVEINGKNIGVISQGDPNTGLEKKLNNVIIEYGCELILCSTRTKGETVKIVQKVAKENEFQVIWTSTYQIDDKSQHLTVNNLKAKHILELINTLKLI